jgi:hypothetical protein
MTKHEPRPVDSEPETAPVAPERSPEPSAGETTPPRQVTSEERPAEGEVARTPSGSLDGAAGMVALTAEPAAPEPTAPEAAAPEPTAPEPTAPEPTAPEPTAPERSASERSAPGPTMTEPVAPDPVAPDRVGPDLGKPPSPEPILPDPVLPPVPAGPRLVTSTRRRVARRPAGPPSGATPSGGDEGPSGSSGAGVRQPGLGTRVADPDEAPTDAESSPLEHAHVPVKKRGHKR